jgi:hypothetical protein
VVRGGCEAGACVETAIGRFDGAACRLDALLDGALCDTLDAKLADTLRARVGRAQGLLRQAGTATKVRKAVKATRKASRQLRALRRAVIKAAKRGKIAPACRDRLLDVIVHRQEELGGLTR